ncbi:MAG: signal recognition particle-docking protein FtsY [Holosporales bacterium]|jgi:fused signal recognition particle receptor|nr:signal recognition particle-docking protein FtsY [Holosporales bacterium]
MIFFKKLKSVINKIGNKKKKDFCELEDILIESDFGVNLASKISSALKDSNNILKDLKEELENILSPLIKDFAFAVNNSRKPFVIVLCGVNGSGKTTTVAKIAKLFKGIGYTVDIAACDTFRVAATEQLEIWAKRLDCKIFKAESQREPASLAFEAVQSSVSDILIIDTAGRLHNNLNLMNELSKIYRVLKKVKESAPDMSILVIDATAGQNVVEQVREFQKLNEISGIIISKMDGGAKGGTIVRISDEFKIPILGVGTGESEFDLEKFSVDKFLKDLME